MVTSQTSNISKDQAATIRREWHAALDAAVSAAHGRGFTAARVTAENLARSIAWLIEHPESAGTAFRELVRVASSPDDRSLDLSVLHARMTREFGGLGPKTTALEELAVSIACEQQAAWLGSTGSADLERAQREAAEMFNRLHREQEAAVRRICQRIAGDDAEEAAADVWAGLFQSYWSPESTKRFSGLARLTTLAHTAAVWRVSRSRESSSSVEFEQQYAALSEPSRSASEAEWSEFRAAYCACRDQLPPRQRLVATLRFDQWLRQVDIASIMNCTRGNVNQVLNSAMSGLRICLTGKGFDPAPLEGGPA